MAVLPPLRKLLSAPFFVGLMFGVATTMLGASMRGSAIFRDVQSGSYYDEAIGDMYEVGIIRGYENGTFGPNDYVTRGQLALMLLRFRAHLLGEEVVRREPAVVTEEEEETEETGETEETEQAEEAEEESSSSRARSTASATSASSSASFAERNPAGTLRFTIKAFTVLEASSKASVSIIRAGGHQGAVTVTYATSDGTAKAGSDYAASEGTLSFAPRETSKTFTIDITNDTSTEGNETVTVTLRDPTGGADIGVPASATLTIVDDETASSAAAGGSTSPAAPVHAIVFNAAAYGVGENEGSIVVTVTRTGGTSAVNVNYTLNGGTASAGTDYTATNGTLSFGANETTKTFTVGINDESGVDGNKTVNMALSAPTGGAALGTPRTATLTIIDNETSASGTGSLKFAALLFSAAEGEGVGTITVNRVGGSKGTVSVSYATSNGTAIAGSDYVSTTGTLTFLPGETAKTFTIPVIKDDLQGEGEETVSVQLGTPTGGATLGSPSSTSLKISG